MTSEIGIRALQQHASDAVARAVSGETLVITDRGRPVARLTALGGSTLEQLLAAGLARAPRRSLQELPGPLPAAAGPTLSELLQQQRESER